MSNQQGTNHHGKEIERLSEWVGKLDGTVKSLTMEMTERRIADENMKEDISELTQAVKELTRALGSEGPQKVSLFTRMSVLETKVYLGGAVAGGVAGTIVPVVLTIVGYLILSALGVDVPPSGG
jgi:hypothetical protein